ncbi:telomeric repeat-binding factor 1 isoform X1 [Neopsephotus bourkii]|uniref:telomeric repeat-binding factor 1 isoform X1 n=1 Tax=Neopsephotus bourkii TaxID=309878 RepID=UPI002AA550D9|nr:telomeric repeat-binding factor 1 isoform X1 [Neopsephotus bourkii]
MALAVGESSGLSAEVKAVAAGWMLEFSCSCLCRHFGDGCPAEFQRWSDVAQALINGLSKIPTHQEKNVYLCQLLIRIAKGKKLECYFENQKRISPLESALSFWTLLEREEVELEKLHKDIRQLIQIQPLRMKLATVIKSKDPHVPLLQTFSYNVLISKIKSYIELFMKENETNFLLQAAMKEVESQGPGAIALQSKTVNADKNDKKNLETRQGLTKEQHSTTDQSPRDVRNPAVRPCSGGKLGERTVLQSLNGLKNVEKHEHALGSLRKRQRWTYKEDLQLKLGIKEFGVGNWAKILVHGNFNNRTSVMLKDRWRTLCKIQQG